MLAPCSNREPTKCSQPAVPGFELDGFDVVPRIPIQYYDSPGMYRYKKARKQDPNQE